MILRQKTSMINWKGLLLRPIRNNPLNYSIQRTKRVAYLVRFFRRYRPINCQCLRDNAAVKVEREEAKFDLLLANSIKITGIIDRVDRLTDGALGVVDYKSGKNVFDIQKFYNGLSPQLVTYLKLFARPIRLMLISFFGHVSSHADPQLT